MYRRTVLVLALSSIAGCLGVDTDPDQTEGDDPQPDTDSNPDDDDYTDDETDPAEQEPQIEIGSIRIGRANDTVDAVDELEQGERLGTVVTYRFSNVDDPIDIDLELRTDDDTVTGTGESQPPLDSTGDDETTLAIPTDDIEPGTYTVRVTVTSGDATDTAESTLELVSTQ